MRLSNPVSLFFKCCLFAAFCFCTGCLDITEEYFFNTDQSGRYVMSMDLSKMMGKMGDSWQRQRDSLIELGRPLQVDSSFFVLDREPDSIRQFVQHPELFSKFKGRILLDYEKKKSIVQFSFDYKNLDELGFFWKEWQQYKHLSDSIQGKKTEQNGNELTDNDVPNFAGNQLPEVKFKGKKFSMVYQFKPDENQDVKGIMEDDNAFARNLLKSFKYNLVLHFPKEVKSFKGEGYKKDGKTVVLQTNFYDLAARQHGMNVEVKLK